MTSVTTIRALTTRAAMLGFALAALSACGGSTDSTITVPVKDVVPATITAVSTDTIRGVAGGAAGGSLTVTVKNKAGDPIDSALVTFAVASGGGTLSGTNIRTNSAGQATTTWTLGSSATVQTVTATVGALPAVTFVAIASAGPAAAIAKVAGDAQTATVGSNVAIPPSVKVTDRFGNPVAGVLVSFTAGSNGGLVNGGAVNTGADGVATVASWRLGSIAGAYTLTATAGTFTTTFTATAQVGAAAVLTLTPTGPFALNAGQTATITARVADASGNVLTNAPVTFTSSNSNVASVSSTGVITANGAGTATITASSGAATANVSVSVTGHPTGTTVASTIVLNTTPGDVVFAANSTIIALNLAQQIAFFDATAAITQGTVLQLTSAVPILLSGKNTSTPILAVNQGTTSRVWYVDPVSQTVVDSVDITEAVASAAIKSDGSRAYFLLPNSGQLAVLNVASRTQSRIELGGQTTRIKIDRGDTLLYAMTSIGLVFEVDTRTNAVTRQIQLPAGTVTDFDLSRDGQLMFLLDGPNGVIRIFNITGTNPVLRRTVGVSQNATSIILSPDDQQIWTTHNTPNKVTWYTGSVANGYLSTGDIGLALGNIPMRVYFSPTGSFAAITESGGTVDIIR